MRAIFSDGFDRADSGTVDAINWTENAAGDWSIVSGKVRSVNPLTVLVTTTAAHAPVADCKVSYKRALTGTSWDTGVLLRTNSTGTTGYFLDPIGTGPSNTMDIWRIDGALTSDVQIGSTVTGLTLNDGDIYALMAVTNPITGNVDLTGYLNGVAVITATDSSGSKILTAGQTGIINWNNTNDFDDFLVEDFGAAAWPRRGISGPGKHPGQRKFAPVSRGYPASAVDVTVALSGQQITLAQGTLIPGDSIAITGQSLAIALGTAIPVSTKALTGSAIASSAGTLVPALSLVLTGLSVSLGQGNISAGGDLTLSLTGQLISSSAGTLVPSTAIAATGQSIASASGTVIPATSMALSGQAVASSLGTLAPTLSLALTGIQISIGQGNLSAPGNVTVALTGQLISSAQGTLVPAIAKALLGTSAQAFTGTLIPGTSITPSGLSIALAAGSLGKALTVSIAGSVITASQGTITVFDPSLVPGDIDSTRMVRVTIRMDLSTLRVAPPKNTIH